VIASNAEAKSGRMVRVRLDREMELFDRLPFVLREAIRYAPSNVAVNSVAKLLRRGVPIADIVEAIRETWATKECRRPR